MKFGIVGGAGHMGKSIARFLRKEGFEVAISDVNSELAEKVGEETGAEVLGNRELARGSDVVIVSVPVQETGKVLEEVSEEMKEGALLTEISSVKAPVAESLRKAAQSEINVVSIHPLFGPHDRGRVAVIPVKGETGKVLDFLRARGFEPFLTDFEEHDRNVAISQSLFFTLNQCLYRGS